MSPKRHRLDALLARGNPFLRGPCFSGPQDHRFCRGVLHRWPVVLAADRVHQDGGPIHYVDKTFRCPCPCGHPEPPANAKPGVDPHRVKPCATSPTVLPPRTENPRPEPSGANLGGFTSSQMPQLGRQ